MPLARCLCGALPECLLFCATPGPYSLTSGLCKGFVACFLYMVFILHVNCGAHSSRILHPGWTQQFGVYFPRHHRDIRDIAQGRCGRHCSRGSIMTSTACRSCAPFSQLPSKSARACRTCTRTGWFTGTSPPGTSSSCTSPLHSASKLR